MRYAQTMWRTPVWMDTVCIFYLVAFVASVTDEQECLLEMQIALWVQSVLLAKIHHLLNDTFPKIKYIFSLAPFALEGARQLLALCHSVKIYTTERRS